MIGGEEKQIDFANPIPVHITYQTTFVDDAGKLQLREDVYGLDRRLMSILRGAERQVADVAVERPADPNFRPTPKQGARLRSVAGGVPQFEAIRADFSAETGLKRRQMDLIRTNLADRMTIMYWKSPATFRHTPPVGLRIGGGGTFNLDFPIPMNALATSSRPKAAAAFRFVA